MADLDGPECEEGYGDQQGNDSKHSAHAIVDLRRY